MAIIKSQIEKAKTPKDKEYWIKFLGLGSPYAAVYIAAGKKNFIFSFCNRKK